MDLTALPYIDTDIDRDPNCNKFVNDLIEAEIQTSGGHDVLLKQYLDRITGGKMEPPGKPPRSMDAIDLNRYDIQQANKRFAPEKAAEIACSVLEYEHMKQTNLLLMTQVGREAWKNHAAGLELEAQEMQRQVEMLNTASTTANIERETSQKALESELADLSERWGTLAYSAATLRGALQARDGSCPL